MDTRDLEVFLAILEHGSLQAAAQAIGHARSSLTRRLARLEEEVGHPLFTLTPAGATPTAAGRRLAEEADPLLETIQGVVAQVRRGGEDAARRVTLALSPGIHPAAIQLAVAHIRASQPDLRLTPRVTARPAADLLGTADADAPSAALLLAPQPPEGPFKATALHRTAVRLYASPAYLERWGTPRDLDALGDHVLDLWTDILPSPGHLPLLDGEAVPVLARDLRNDSHALSFAAAAGECIATLPEVLLDLSSRAELPLEPVLPELVGCEVTLWLLWLEAGALGARTQRLRDSVRQFDALLGDAAG